MTSSIQKNLFDAIETVVDQMIKDIRYTSSKIGIVKECNGFNCVVEISGSDTECKLVGHLHAEIKKNDIVVVQDLYNNNVSKYIVSKIGEV